MPSPPGCSPITGMSPQCPPPLPTPGFPSTVRGHAHLPVPKNPPGGHTRTSLAPNPAPHTTGPRSPWARYSSKSMAASAASSSGPVRPFPGPGPVASPVALYFARGGRPRPGLSGPRRGRAALLPPPSHASGMFGVDFMGWKRVYGQEVHGEPAWPRRACVLLGCLSGGSAGMMRPPRPAWCRPSCSFP